MVISNDLDNVEIDIRFKVDYSKTGKAKCRKCKKCIQKDVLRIGKPTIFKNKEILSYFHVSCMFKSFEKARIAQSIIANIGQISGLDELASKDKLYIMELVEKLQPIRDKVGHKVFEQKKKDSLPTPSKKCSPQQSFGGNALKVLYTNADQLTNAKIDELLLKIKQHKPLIVAICEVKPKNRADLDLLAY